MSLPMNKLQPENNNAVSTGKPWTRIPKLIVFDLDFTLWYREMYELAGPPFHRDTDGIVHACDGEAVHLFDDVHPILHEIALSPAFADTRVAVASSTEFPAWARECMGLILVHFQAMSEDEKDQQRKRQLNATAEPLGKLLHFQAIYPTNKRVHFKQLRDESGVEYEDMLFFDNESGNYQDISSIGVTSVYCPDGMTLDAWREGMGKFQK
ncbi:Aste57867_16648 [Aphanomyces stellatus]|nr:hypothetical protein As57867_016591 [Aphanomyces stellatus]VFT93419.1 Aste57867_16648 [Aphanomyces stellatus]